MVDEDVELTYTVTIRTCGKPDKVRQDTGKRLAKICGLSFSSVDVVDADTRYLWDANNHGGFGESCALTPGTTNV